MLDGEPIVVVQDGKPIEKNLKRERITLEDLAAAAPSPEHRARSTTSPWAVLETSGVISFIKKPDA